MTLTKEVLDELQYATQLSIDSDFTKVQCDAQVMLQVLASARRESELREKLAGLVVELRREASDMERRVGRELSATYVNAKLEDADRIATILEKP